MYSQQRLVTARELNQFTSLHNFDSQKMADHVSLRATENENCAVSRHVSVDHYILPLNYLSNNLHFITNGSERFSKTNSTDPRHSVPLRLHQDSARYIILN